MLSRKKKIQLVHCSQAHNWERFENRAAGRAKRLQLSIVLQEMLPVIRSI